MCGIYAYIGNRNDAPRLVLDGLRSLEYRGYDSWGIAVKTKEENLLVEKHIGKIAGSIIPKSSLVNRKSNLSIGHTRWATHGGVTIKNAHPHLDCRGQIAVVHNGIVENYQIIKNNLSKAKHHFLSDTDTEVIPHLIEDNLRKYGIVEAVRRTFNKLSGLSAIVVLDSKTNTLIAAKNGSPLVVGIGKKEFFLASDLSAITPHTQDILFLKDNEMVVLKENLTLFSLPKGKKITPKIEKVDFKIDEAKLGKHKHFMIKEISDQPKVIENILFEYDDQIKNLATVIKHARGTFFIAAGTAYNACLAGIYLFSKVAGIHVNSAIASEFNYLEHFLNKDSLVMALSQSGETIDVIEPLTRAQIKGAKIAAVVNVLGSSIYRMADYKMLLGAGPEKAVASTKAYMAKITILLLLSYALIGKTQEIKPKIKKAADEVEKMLFLEFTSSIKKLAHKLKNTKNIYLIGRGVSYPSALEGALKIKEVSYVPTEGLAGGELKHGTIALIEKGTPCIVFAPNDETYEAIISNAIEIRSRGGFIIGISHKNSPAFDNWIKVKDLGDATLLTQIVPLQLLAYYLALARGLKNPDMPRNLAKSVTVK